MFGIGLPEMILILALALIVVGPEKLPELARSLARGIMELKKTAEGFKEQLKEENHLLEDIRPDLEDAAKSFRSNILDHPEKGKTSLFGDKDESSAVDNAAKAYEELTRAGINPGETSSAEPQPEVAKAAQGAQDQPAPQPEPASTDVPQAADDSAARPAGDAS